MKQMVFLPLYWRERQVSMASMKLITSLLVLLLFSVPAHAAPKCYGAKEAAAEAAIRIHSELMVTALTCQYDTRGQSLVDKYVAFGNRNNARLRDAEQTLINFHKSSSGVGVATLDKMRTTLSNEYAERIALNDPGVYCPKVADTVAAAAEWNAAQFETAIARAVANGPSMTPLCVVEAKAQ